MAFETTNGTLHFAEHGRSPEAGVARWQDRITPIQRRIFGGCHLNRPISQLVADAGFALGEHGAGYEKGPKVFSYMYTGVATKQP